MCGLSNPLIVLDGYLSGTSSCTNAALFVSSGHAGDVLSYDAVSPMLVTVTVKTKN